MTNHGGIWRSFTNTRARIGAIIGIVALLAAACGSTTEVDASADASQPPVEAESEEAVEESSDTAVEEGLEIRISDELTVLTEVAPVEDLDLDNIGIDDPPEATCASGAEARTPFTLPFPVEAATAQFADAHTVSFQRFVFDSADEATAALELYGPGNCEAVVETIDGVPSDDVNIIEDQALELAADLVFPTATTLVSDPVMIGGPAGLLLIQNGAEIVLVVAIAPTVDDITAALETAAGPYS